MAMAAAGRTVQAVTDRQFQSSQASLAGVDSDIAAKLITASADIALILDREGVIRDVACGEADDSTGDWRAWVGRRWVDTVTVESRPKIEELLHDVAAGAPGAWRQVNHPTPSGVDLPVRYTVVAAGNPGFSVAIGRDLRTISMLQQRLLDAQQSMEREYTRLRSAETRYRLLFHIAAEAVMIVDAGTEKVVEANPASGHLLGCPVEEIIGRPLRQIFDADGAAAVHAMTVTVKAVGRAEDVRARLLDGDFRVTVSASMFRQGSSTFFLLRLTTEPGLNSAPLGGDLGSKLLEVVEDLPDGFVVTGTDMRVLTANSAFLELVQVPTAEQIRGYSLDRWLGRTGVDFGVLSANLREHGVVRHFATVVRGEYGSQEDVEVSAVSVANDAMPCLGFTIRSIGRRATSSVASNADLPRAVEQLTELVGRVSLKELVRDTTDLIERLCIEAALELTGNNRASAAEMLGLSRQSLYVKLRRYGLIDSDVDNSC